MYETKTKFGKLNVRFPETIQFSKLGLPEFEKLNHLRNQII